jgi:hypothetical protein
VESTTTTALQLRCIVTTSVRMNLAPAPSSFATFACLLPALVFAGCAKGHPIAAGLPDAGEGPPPELVPASIQTVVTPTTVQAGAALNVDCQVFDANGERILDLEGQVPKVVHEPRFVFESDSDGTLIATTVGTGNVACTLATHGLFDVGVEVTIVPGPAHTVITRLTEDRITAGNRASAVCHVYDAFGNPIEGADASLFVSPSGGGVEVDGLETTITASGTYEVTCGVSGAAYTESDFLRVDPALPYSMIVGLRPERVPFRIRDQTLLEADVRDRYGNRVTGAVLEYSASGNITSQNGARFTFESDGAATLRARVTSPIDPEVAEVAASVNVVVNTTGPDIECLRIDNYEPSPAYMTHRTPGTTVSFRVAVSDASGIAQVRIGGVAATSAGRGVYAASRMVGWGVNFVDVVAVDEYGLENSQTCYFLASDKWTGENAFMAGAVGFRMNQSAVGPGTSGQLTSLNEILRVILNSSALRTMVDQGLPGTINSGGCGFFACNPTVTYERGSLSWGAVTSALTLINGGLRAQITIPNVRLKVYACGTSCCIGGSIITATASTVSATIDFGLALQNGVLRASVASTPTVTVGGVSLDGSGFCGFLINLIQSFFENTLRNAIRDALQGFIGSQVGPMLDNLVSSLDVSSLGSTFNVPRLDGSGNVSLGFGIELSSLSITANTRMLLGIGTRFTPGAFAHNRPSLGVARRTDTILLDPPITSPRTIGLSFYEGAINQVLHALWRGGWFQASLDLGGGAQVVMDALIPPVVHIQGSGARLMLGGIRATVRVPPLIDDPPFQVMFGGVASAKVALSGDSLTFGNIAIDVENDLYVSFDDPISDDARLVLTSVLGSVLERVLLDAVNDGLPAIPIPSFSLPPEVAQFGLPANAQLGITSPVLTTSGEHFRLQGSFGVK